MHSIKGKWQVLAGFGSTVDFHTFPFLLHALFHALPFRKATATERITMSSCTTHHGQNANENLFLAFKLSPLLFPLLNSNSAESGMPILY